MKKFLCALLLGAATIASPQMVRAAAAGPFTITGGAGYTYENNVLTITANGTYTIGMASPGTTTTTDRIEVKSGLTGVNITLNGVSIDLTDLEGGSVDTETAFGMAGAKVNLTLQGENTLTGGRQGAALRVPFGATLTVTAASTGSLTATAVTSGAAIGGGNREAGGNVIINGGMIDAIGAYWAAAIGGGDYGNGGAVSVTGGYLHTVGTIGGGFNGAGGTVNISGGTVYAEAQGARAGIGRGTYTYSSENSSGTLTITGGSLHRVYAGGKADSDEARATNGVSDLYPVELSGMPGGTALTSATVNGTNYPVKDVTSSKCFLWLPWGERRIVVAAGGETWMGIVAVRESNTLTLVSQSDMIPVTGITGIESSMTTGVMTLGGTVEPAGASFKTIVWSVADAGTTGASIVNNNSLTTSAPGTAKIRATITFGTSATVNYTQDFDIEVTTIGGEGFEGDGTSASPYLIKTETDLRRLAEQVDGGNNFSSQYFRLENDIALTLLWTPIGRSPSVYFGGIFDGNYHTVENLTIPSVSGNQGLFGYISGGRVGNLGLVNVNISGTGSSGGVVGNLSGGTIDHCFVTGSVSGNTAGGIAGSMYGGTVTHCYNTASVTASGSNNRAGGIVGGMTTTSGLLVEYCWSSGLVNAAYFLGGIAGMGGGNIRYCVALPSSIAKLTGTSRSSRVVGQYGTFTNNYAWDGLAKHNTSLGDDGTDWSASQIRTAASWTIGPMGFTAAGGWSTADGKMPVLSGPWTPGKQDDAIPVWITVPTGTIVFTLQPADVTVDELDTPTATFTAAAIVTGNPAATMTYRWQVSTDGENFNDVTGGSGAATASYTTPTLTAADNGNLYRVVANGSANSAAATLTVNAPKVPVTNTGGAAAVTYAGATFDLAATGGLFTVDANAGAKTYTIETGGTGAGTIGADKKTLTVTKAGTFTVGLATASTGTHAAGAKVTATLTVNKGAQSAPTGLLVADATTHGGADGKITELAPSTKYEYKKDSGAYTAATSNAGGEITGLTAGTYVVRLAATDLHNTGPDSEAITVGQPAAPVAPVITGPTAMALIVGCAAASSDVFEVTGNPAPTVTKTGGDAKITWNDATMKLDIAAGLDVGAYPVTLQAANGVGLDAEHTFTLTIVQTQSSLDVESVAAAKAAIEKGSYVVDQAVANTEEEVKAWLAERIGALIASIGVTAGMITIGDFEAAGGGTDGSFDFTVTLSKGDATGSASDHGTITAPPRHHNHPACPRDLRRR